MSDHLNVSTVGVDFIMSDSIGFRSSAGIVGRSRRTLAHSVIRAWRCYLIRRSCRTAARFLWGLDDDALAEIELRRTEIPYAVLQLEVALLRHYGCASSASSPHGDAP